MNKWTPETKRQREFDREWKEIQLENARTDYNDRVNLEFACITGAAWPYICDTGNEAIDAMLPEYQDLLEQEITHQWGECEIVFDSKRKRIWVFAKDGRGMELIGQRFATREEMIEPEPEEDLSTLFD